MTFAAGIVFILFSAIGFSQSKQIDFAPIDRNVLAIDDVSPASLSYKLTVPYTTELEKVRAIFKWITEHIAYRIYIPSRKWNNSHVHYEEPEDDQPLKPLNERVSLLVLKRRTAICDQYARLFKTLCDYAGLCSEIITGYAKPNNRSAKRFGSNHSWNAVQIDGVWRLLDVTWASGVISFSGREFIKQFDEFYFLTPPEFFIRDHYPEDLRWSLLQEPPTLREFANSPFKYSGFIKTSITSMSPAKGIIETFVGDTVKIELETKNAIINFFVTDTYPDDLSVIEPSTSVLSTDKKHRIDYIPSSIQSEWLYVVLNEELVLRYKLKFRKEEIGYANKHE